MFYTGLDIHRKFIYATVLDDNSQIVQQGKFLANEIDFDNFLGFLPPRQVKVVMIMRLMTKERQTVLFFVNGILIDESNF